MVSYLQLARATPGAELHTGQAELQLPPHNRAGCFVQPTVITGIPDQHRYRGTTDTLRCSKPLSTIHRASQQHVVQVHAGGDIRAGDLRHRV